MRLLALVPLALLLVTVPAPAADACSSHDPAGCLDEVDDPAWHVVERAVDYVECQIDPWTDICRL